MPNRSYVYDFDHVHELPPRELADLLGGKGANLAEMCRLGITVPSGQENEYLITIRDKLELIAAEAGAIVTSAMGEPILYNKPQPLDFGLICCSPGIHRAAVERLKGRAWTILANT